MSKKTFKIFVGNVPYECSDNEFENCFKDIEGFVKGEIIREHKTNFSRGFGFVTLKTRQDAINLSKRNDIEFKNRVLRFTTYQNETQKEIKSDELSYLLISDIPTDKLNDDCSNWLRKLFRNYEPIGKCFLRTNHDDGSYLNSAIIEILNENYFSDLVEKKEIIIDGFEFNINKYRMRNYIKKKQETETYSAYVTSKTMNINHKN